MWISIHFWSALPHVTVWSQFCEPVEFCGLNCRRLIKAAKCVTFEIFVYLSRLKLLCQSSHQTYPILDQRLWLAWHVPGLVDICLNGRGARPICRSAQTMSSVDLPAFQARKRYLCYFCSACVCLCVSVCYACRHFHVIVKSAKLACL